jgi:hypothetical protein
MSQVRQGGHLMRPCCTWNTPDARANRPGDVRRDFRGATSSSAWCCPRATVGGHGSGGGVHNARPGAVRLHETLPASRRAVVPRSMSSSLGRRFRQSPQRAAGRIESIGHRTAPSGGCAPAPRDPFSRAGVVLHRTPPSVVPTSTWGPATSPSVARGLQGVGTARRSACVSRFFGRSRPFLLTDAPPDGRLRDAHH